MVHYKAFDEQGFFTFGRFAAFRGVHRVHGPQKDVPENPGTWDPQEAREE